MSDELLSAYPTPNPGPANEEIDHLDEHCAAFLALCPFVVIASASAAGEPDVSPRGGPPIRRRPSATHPPTARRMRNLPGEASGAEPQR